MSLLHRKKKPIPVAPSTEIPPIMLERPEGMDREVYKALRKLQNKRIKIHLKGESK